MLGGLGWQELLLVLLIVLVIFGGSKIPEIARSLGRGIGEFKKGLKEEDPEEEKKKKEE